MATIQVVTGHFGEFAVHPLNAIPRSRLYF